MLLLDLLVAIFHGELFTAVDGFYGFLCKFINIHNRSPPHIRLCNFVYLVNFLDDELLSFESLPSNFF